MAYSVRDVLTAMVNVFTNNNTTTSGGLSYNLNKSVRKIGKGSPKIGVALTEYPVVLVQPATWSEDQSLIGNNARRDIELSLRIYAMTQDNSSAGSADDEIYKLTENVLTVLRNNIDLSQTVDWCGDPVVEWSTDEEDATYVQSAEITIQAKAVSRT